MSLDRCDRFTTYYTLEDTVKHPGLPRPQGSTSGAERSHLLKVLCISLEARRCPYSRFHQSSVRVGIPSVIISLQGLSKSGCVSLDTHVIASTFKLKGN